MSYVDSLRQEIARLERKRDFELRIHCNRVAARYDREIEDLKKELKDAES